MPHVPAVERTPPTLEAVASLAGVSRSTVSRVVNGSNIVRPDVVQSVQAAIDELGYVPNRAARSLANRQSMAIALVIPEDTTIFFGDPYFALVVNGITQGFEDSEYVLNLQLGSRSPTPKTIRYLTGGNVDGAIVVSHHLYSETLISKLLATLPVVFGGRPLDRDDRSNYFVDVDNRAAAARATRYLIEKGRSRIATITGSPDMPAGIDRELGWRDALAAAGLSDHRLVHGNFTRAGGANAMRKLLTDHPDLDAVFVGNDLMAAGAVAVLRGAAIAIPGQVAVVGFDDSSAAVESEPQLTTVSQPSEEMGYRMAQIMLAVLRGESPERETIMPTAIVERGSA